MGPKFVVQFDDEIDEILKELARARKKPKSQLLQEALNSETNRCAACCNGFHSPSVHGKSKKIVIMSGW